MRGSYRGRIAPPGIPKMSVTPAASRECTRLCAPVICSLISSFFVRAYSMKNPPTRLGNGGRAWGVCVLAHALDNYYNLGHEKNHTHPSHSCHPLFRVSQATNSAPVRVGRGPRGAISLQPRRETSRTAPVSADVTMAA